MRMFNVVLGKQNNTIVSANLKKPKHQTAFSQQFIVSRSMVYQNVFHLIRRGICHMIVVSPHLPFIIVLPTLENDLFEIS